MLEEANAANAKGKRKCVCTWKTPMCCELWREAYRKSAEHHMKESKRRAVEAKGKRSKVLGEAHAADKNR